MRNRNIILELNVFPSTHLTFYRTKWIHLFFSRLLQKASAPRIDHSVCHLSSVTHKHYTLTNCTLKQSIQHSDAIMKLVSNCECFSHHFWSNCSINPQLFGAHEPDSIDYHPLNYSNNKLKQQRGKDNCHRDKTGRWLSPVSAPCPCPSLSGRQSSAGQRGELWFSVVKSWLDVCFLSVLQKLSDIWCRLTDKPAGCSHSSWSWTAWLDPIKPTESSVCAESLVTGEHLYLQITKMN